MQPGDLRPLSELERGYLQRLLSVEFPGRSELIGQIESALVRTIDSDGSIQIEPQNDIRAPVVKRIPVEADTVDEDGVPVHFLLHVLDSRASELEIYKADGSQIRRTPLPDELNVTVLPE